MHRDLFADWWNPIPMIVACCICLGPIIFVSIVESFDLSAFTADPLGSALSAQLKDKYYRLPTYVTVARRTALFDPDHLHYEGAPIPWGGAYSTIPTYGFVPAYARLDSLPGRIRTDVLIALRAALRYPLPGQETALLASSALPYGIVPSVSGAVDGSMADNLPIYPLISLLACDVILVIRANPACKNETSLLEQWQRIDRLLRIKEYDEMNARRADPNPLPPIVGPPKSERKSPAEPPRFPAHWPKILEVAPDLLPLPAWKDLIQRTMNFRPRFTVPLMNKGHVFMKKWLRTGVLDEFRETQPGLIFYSERP